MAYLIAMMAGAKVVASGVGCSSAAKNLAQGLHCTHRSKDKPWVVEVGLHEIVLRWRVVWCGCVGEFGVCGVSPHPKKMAPPIGSYGVHGTESLQRNVDHNNQP